MTFARNIRKFICLAFVPVEHVPSAFETLAENLDDDQDYLEFITYFERTWVRKFNRTRTLESEAIFPPRIWNVRCALMNESNRTNNAVEGWNNQLNNYSKCSHPHLHKFIQVVKDDMTAYRTKIIQIRSGANLQPQRTKYKDHSQFLINIVERAEDDVTLLIENMSLRLVL